MLVFPSNFDLHLAGEERRKEEGRRIERRRDKKRRLRRKRGGEKIRREERRNNARVEGRWDLLAMFHLVGLGPTKGATQKFHGPG